MGVSLAMGKQGGIALVKKRGKDYMRGLGRRGARAFWSKYRMMPVGTSSFAIVDRETDKIVAYNPGYEKHK